MAIPVVRWLASVAAVALLYYGAARLGLLMQLPGTNASAVWPPSGIGLAALLLFGYRVWPGITIGAFLANLLTLIDNETGSFVQNGLLASAGICVGNTLEHVIALWLLRRRVWSGSPFDRPSDVVRFTSAAIVACGVAAICGATTLCLAGVIPADIFVRVCYTWWLGDLAGMLVLTPSLYCWWQAPRLGLSASRTMELVGLFALTALAAEVIFGSWIASPIGSLPFLVIPGLLWAAFRFQQRETSSLAVVVSVIAIWHTWSAMSNMTGSQADRPPAFAPFLSPAITANDSLLLLQIFICAVVETAMMLAAAVAERATAEQALADSERRFRTIFEQAGVGVALIETATSRFVRINQRYCDLVGYSIEEMTRATFQEITHPEDLQEDLVNMRRLSAGEIREFTMEKRYLRKDGSIIWVKLAVSPSWQPGEKQEYHIAIVEDVTERKRAEQEIKRYAAELERSNRELDQFAYAASHDLTAPLRAVDNLAEWITEDAGPLLPEASQRDLAMLRQRIKRMQRLLDDTLAYSRVGRIQHKIYEVNCQELVRDLVKMLAPPGRMTLSIGALPVLSTERTPLEQVFLNLIDNAIKHHHRDNGRIEITARELEKQVEFVVCDDGPGIAAEFHQQVFEMFRTLRPRDDVEGSGMGLALVKKIVENQGGKVTLKSAPGHGSVFSFTWPKSV